MAPRLITVILFVAPCLAQEVPDWDVPPPIERCVTAIGKSYEISQGINPYYLRGDFDRDGIPDYAVLVRASAERTQGILICPGGKTKRATVLGAGKNFHQMVDLSFGAWRVYPKGKVGRGVGEGPPPQLMSDAMLLIWPESASAIVYWDGKRFRWYQQGD